MPRPRGKYAAMLDPETWDYIDEVDRLFGPDLAGLPLGEQRQFYAALCRHFHPGRPPEVAVADDTVPGPGGGIPVRRYTVPSAVEGMTVLYFHGGGFVFGDLDSHDDFCADLCAAVGVEVVSVDYRLAPEHLHPAPHGDALAAFRWLEGRAGRIVLAGESAGGNLAAGVAQACRSSAALSGLLMVYPSLGGPPDTASAIEHADAPLMAARDSEHYAGLRTGGTPPKGDATFAPLEGADSAGLPPTLISVAECDPLADDGRIYAARVIEAGGQARCRVEPRLTHSFLRSRFTVARASDAFDAIVADARALVAGDWSRDPG
ncbi:alpha/beta hydrolase fold domain-containing protein [Rhodobacterales bacterium HKCCE2091]|nr:alpha/beta hydrolase fold domain-containing protein [Rhodobacterales bacterium HKCCE2091]